MTTMNYRCYISIQRDKRGSATAATDAARYLASRGYDVLSMSSRHVTISGTSLLYSQVFGTGIVLASRGIPAFAKRPISPGPIAVLIKGLLLDHPAHFMGWEWPDPGQQFVSDHFSPSQAPNLRFKDNYDASATQFNSLLFPSDILDLHGVNSTDLVEHQGELVTIFTLDSGVDFNCPFFTDNEDLKKQVLVVGTSSTDDAQVAANVNSGLGDVLGHGTMCVAGMLMLAPRTLVVMITNPWDLPAPTPEQQDAISLGKLSSNDVLVGLGRVLEFVEAMGTGRSDFPCIVSLSVGVTPDVFETQDKYNEYANTLRGLVRELGVLGVLVLGAAGNETAHYMSIPAHMNEVICVGGAYPNKLGEVIRWFVSDYSLCGVDGVPVAATYAPNRVFPDICGIEGTDVVRHKMKQSATHYTPAGWSHEGQVSLCLPVGKGLSGTQLQTFKMTLPPPPGMNPILWWLAIMALGGISMDATLTAYTEQTDGWVVAPGGTSFATATTAGAIAVVASHFPKLFYTILTKSGGNNAFVRSLLWEACEDVILGLALVSKPTAVFPFEPTGGGWEVPTPGSDKASGAGVLLAKKLYQVASDTWAAIGNLVA